MRTQRVAHLEFSDKVLWLYASFFRISASNEGYHTIRMLCTRGSFFYCLSDVCHADFQQAFIVNTF